MDKAKCTDDSHATRDSPTCSAECQAQLLTSLASSDEALKTACLTLSDRHRCGRDDFYIPYYCGSQLCTINGKRDADQQSIISRLISSCESSGLINLALLDQDRDILGALLDEHEPIHRQQRFSTTPAVAFPAATASGFPEEGFHTITIKTSFSSIPSIVHDLTASGLSATHLAISVESSKYQHHQRSTVANQVSSTTKVTIGVSVMVGVLVIIGFIGWHLRMKIRFRNKKRISRPIKPISPPATPLISPSSSHAAPPKAPLTPPARLQERRFLLPRALSLRRNNQRRRSDGPSSQDKVGMPLAPLSPLSTSNARRSPEEGEHQGITSTTSISMTKSPARPPRDDNPSETSISSVFSHVGTVRAASNVSIGSAQNKYSSATVTELPRPPLRVYEAPPAVGRLTSPGPPPTRALPSLPLDGRTSPLKSPLSPTSPTRRGSPSIASISGSSVSVSEGNGDSQRVWEGNSHSDLRGSVEVALQSPRRVRHVRSPLLNEVRLDKVL
ncbi:uncharacterized protein TrAFT101_005007 [Trichoderma asperellum]|uniref:uncharacterized protein n=1 Tax=Trichoderma asperellum TaxID=101201 RepID=UPI003320C894|nr:hypothetical protein TrAFT101_005007 [Trichoderma asperellum]